MVRRNNLKKLDIFNLVKLEYLDISNDLWLIDKIFNKISYLDISNNKKLKYLITENNIFQKEKIIRRRRIYFLNEKTLLTEVGRNAVQNKRNLIENGVERNRIKNNINKCIRCNKYINKYNLINYRKIIIETNKPENYNYNLSPTQLIIIKTCC